MKLEYIGARIWRITKDGKTFAQIEERDDYIIVYPSKQKTLGNMLFCRPFEKEKD